MQKRALCFVRLDKDGLFKPLDFLFMFFGPLALWHNACQGISRVHVLRKNLIGARSHRRPRVDAGLRSKSRGDNVNYMSTSTTKDIARRKKIVAQGRLGWHLDVGNSERGTSKIVTASWS